VSSSTTPTEPTSGGKGRPTPSRKEAEAARRERVKPTLTKKEARKKSRTAARAAQQSSYQAMVSGDERAFPPRDQGPVRRFVRDYIDGRRLFSEFFLPVMIVILMLSLLPFPQVVQYVTLLWLVGIALVIAEIAWLWWSLKKNLRVRFPEGNWGRGDLFYGIMRATQLRRLRLPRPALKPGQPPR
jgi:hypothetical protein